MFIRGRCLCEGGVYFQHFLFTCGDCSRVAFNRGNTVHVPMHGQITHTRNHYMYIGNGTLRPTFISTYYVSASIAGKILLICQRLHSIPVTCTYVVKDRTSHTTSLRQRSELERACQAGASPGLVKISTFTLLPVDPSFMPLGVNFLDNHKSITVSW